ncbi:hypothetical protein L873DRAFT_565252 [Choiromyces venosus 120613-1]|uniref:Uncharacterized protein n=1 Tax=Choiromyces venosus 120613-1 TaxID=1336337 RepID=A0A3N4JYL0_9PEZI|nr:hypothetical protein L873DRAFT_565252 [Choiromyces venosus 120613-1]
MAYNTRSSTHTTRSKTTTPHKPTTTTAAAASKPTPKSAPSKITTGTTKKTSSHRTGAGVSKKRPSHHKRKPHLSDKLEGALLKVEGTLTGRSGVKAAGTKKLHGTDGKGAKRSGGAIRRSL